MTQAWRREAVPDRAADRILDAAARAFAEQGVSGVGMATIARYAGCSRGTLYRYFPTRHALHLAYVDRTAREIVEAVQARLQGIEGARERLIAGILASLREVRRNPGAAAWFEPGASGMAARMSRSSEVVDTLTATFVARLLGPGRTRRRDRLQARWLVRVIVSLLTLPGDSDAEERALVERFVVPGLMPADR